MTMRHVLAAILGAAIVFGGPVMAQNERATRYDPNEVEWEVLRLDPDGNEVGKRFATEVVATVPGPRRFRLSIGCDLLG